MIRVLHTGDLHIGNFPGPEENGENVRFKDICKCLDAMITGMKEQKPDIAIIAGDIFHQAKVWSDRGLKEQRTAVRFVRELKKTCPVVVMRGTPNHDSEEQFDTLKSTFEGDESVHIVTEPGIKTYCSYDGKKIQIACLPGFDKGYFRSKNPGLSKEEENQVFTKAIADMIIGLKAQCVAAIPSVLVSHYTITGCNMESGQTAFFSQFEPVVYPDTLQAADFDLNCFGHIHRPQKIEGCKNAFYCGAISALNFNDEGQERGYWLHDIEDNGNVKSTFEQLPTRKYKTIRLNDADIEKIINMDIDDFEVPSVKDNVVRVLYDCTDAHNKAFNHARYEAALYGAGAFWVQEITPQNISITVDRKIMNADGTPESNLSEYLAEKEIGSERCKEIIELARPIISEATEKTTLKRHTGSFIPVEIEVKNYRNYKQETFSFDSIRFCTINGNNGAGKSSLFMDAMLDALFEETREGELTGWIRNDPDARSGAIKFTFKLGECLYRVTRTRQKSGKATLNISEFVEGEWVDRSKEKIKDTQQEIINIIGMDSLTLKACALIMQDQYGLFLQADKEARMNILGNILGLAIYSDMENMAADKVTDTNRQIRQLQDRAEIMESGMSDKNTLAENTQKNERIKLDCEKKIEEKQKLINLFEVQLNTQLETAERIVKLNSKLLTLENQKSQKEAVKVSKGRASLLASSLIDQEKIILEGVEGYKQLLQQEKEAIKEKTLQESLAVKKEEIEASIKDSESSVSQLMQKQNNTIERIDALKHDIECAGELKEKYQQYQQKKQQLQDQEMLLPSWEAAKAKAELAERALKELEKNHKDLDTKLEMRISELKRKVMILENSGCPNTEKATCKFLQDAIEAKNELPKKEDERRTTAKTYESEREDAIKALDEANSAVSAVAYSKDEVKVLRADISALEVYVEKYNAIEAQRTELTFLMERLSENAEAQEEAKKKVEIHKAELAKTLEQLEKVKNAKENFEKLQQGIFLSEKWVEKEKLLPVAKQQKKEADSRIEELTEEISKIEAEIEAIQEELNKERELISIEALKMQIATEKAELKSVQATLQSSIMTLGWLKKQEEQVAEQEKQILDIRNIINELSEKAAAYEELKKAFSQDGIPHNIIRSIIPVFEATATNILGQMSQGRMSVEIVTEKVLKSNSKKEVTTLDIIINDVSTGRLPYMSRSGGERVKAALSVILSLSEIKSSKADIQFGFLFIDEPPFLDAPGVQAYCDALEAIQRRYNNLKVMAITHDPAMKSRFPQSIDVVKTEDGSKIIY